jgi:FMN phosphatase YigB (HAD superfamily)
LLCSRCSAPVRPVVAIDIDGTLADYHGHFAEFATLWLGYEPAEEFLFDGQMNYSEWFVSAFDVDVTTFRQIKLAYRQGGMKRIQPIYPGSKELVANLRDYGAEVWLTTTRPHDRFDRVDPDTRAWLERWGINFDGLLYHDHKMRVLSERIEPARVVAVVDDQEDILEEAEALGLGVQILRRQEYNAAVDWDPAEADLNTVYQMIRSLIDEWRRENG